MKDEVGAPAVSRAELLGKQSPSRTAGERASTLPSRVRLPALVIQIDLPAAPVMGKRAASPVVPPLTVVDRVAKCGKCTPPSVIDNLELGQWAEKAGLFLGLACG